jgi:hypothetical protein
LLALEGASNPDRRRTETGREPFLPGVFMLKLLIVIGIVFTLTACSPAPTKDQVRESVKSIMPPTFEVLEVSELKDIPSLYQVVIKIGSQPVVLYMDKKRKYVLSGSLLSLENKGNLTLEAQKKYLTK